jgi:hypothetical protein
MLALTCRQTREGLRPLVESAFRVADGPAELHIGWAVATHARLGKPGQAEAEQLACLLRRKQPLS